MNTNIHSINDTLTAINNQLQQMRQDFTAMDSRLTAMDLRIDARFNRIDARFTRMATENSTRFDDLESRLTTMAEDNNTRFERTDSQLVGLGTRIDSHFEGVDKAFDKQNIRMMALHNNAMSRLDNRLPGASSNDLEPLFNLETGQKIQDKPTISGLGRMRSAALENCLRGLEIDPKESEEDKREQLSAAYGARTIVYFGAP
ncbi:hypothetical protein E4U56_004390 [Claviceps arundinis]|uniref:Uncharacterized protein n=1 Tax=Claviceps arundinis TaxID=1623583 RepID=A0A9P7MNN9_9HYPO|nr:hypothetical protein E4U56_004390 [Claviceps arundinis]